MVRDVPGTQAKLASSFLFFNYCLLTDSRERQELENSDFGTQCLALIIQQKYFIAFSILKPT